METNQQKLIIYTDGGARGNPGPAAIGIVIQETRSKKPALAKTSADKQETSKKYSEQIGDATNNVAEYKAVIFALKKAKALLGADKAKETELEIRSDSELLVSQVRGEYKIKDKELQPLFIDVWNKMQNFKRVNFVLISREENREADKLVNRALDTLL